MAIKAAARVSKSSPSGLSSSRRVALPRGRGLWVGAALAALVVFTVLARTQSPRLPTHVKARDWSEWFLYPVERNPPPQAINCDLNAVHAADEQNIWAVGNLGMIVHSDDGGRTWVKQPIVGPAPSPPATASPTPSATASPTSAGDTQTSDSGAAPPVYRKPAAGGDNLAASSNTSTPRTSAAGPARSVATSGRPTRPSEVDSLGIDESAGRNSDEEFAHALSKAARVGDEITSEGLSIAQVVPPQSPTPTPRLDPSPQQRPPGEIPFDPDPLRRGGSSGRASSPTPTPRAASPRPTQTPARQRPTPAASPANQNANQSPTASPTPTVTPTATSSPAAQGVAQEDLVAVIFNGTQYGWAAGRFKSATYTQFFSTNDGGNSWYSGRLGIPAGASREPRAARYIQGTLPLAFDLGSSTLVYAQSVLGNDGTAIFLPLKISFAISGDQLSDFIRGTKFYFLGQG